ncbi:MAG: hypothetical protein CMH52_08955 [Myxococcales bacterium]|nr:hypothetical protein [Myxococcales bacterium]
MVTLIFQRSLVDDLLQDQHYPANSISAELLTERGKSPFCLDVYHDFERLSLATLMERTV